MSKRLTQAEIDEIHKLHAEGLSDRQIAARVDRALYTVKRHLDPEFKKRHNEAGKMWRKANPEKGNEWRRKRVAEDPTYHDKAYRRNREKRIESVKKYYQKNKEEIHKKQLKRRRERKQTDPSFRIACNLRSRIAKAIRRSVDRGTKSGSAVQDLGCSIQELKTWIELQFEPGMSWSNYGQWHIDHVRPLASFDLSDRLQFLEACHFTNLQPLWADENLSKGDSELT